MHLAAVKARTGQGKQKVGHNAIKLIVSRKTLERLEQYRKQVGESGVGPSRRDSALDDDVSAAAQLWSRSPSPVNARSRRGEALARLEKTFPVDRGAIVEPAFSGSYEKDLQNPLLFLAERARNGWRIEESLDPAPPILPAANAPLPAHDLSLLGSWGAQELQGVFENQRTFFGLGLHGSRRDVGAGLDAVQRGVIKDDEVSELFAA